MNVQALPPSNLDADKNVRWSLDDLHLSGTQI